VLEIDVGAEPIGPLEHRSASGGRPEAEGGYTS
jgi:hypothetical protein